MSPDHADLAAKIGETITQVTPPGFLTHPTQYTPHSAVTGPGVLDTNAETMCSGRDRRGGGSAGPEGRNGRKLHGATGEVQYSKILRSSVHYVLYVVEDVEILHETCFVYVQMYRCGWDHNAFCPPHHWVSRPEGELPNVPECKPVGSEMR